MADFKDKVVVITGGSEGIGKALVQQFLTLGAKVATCGRNEGKLALLTQEHPTSHLFTMKVDVAVQADCDAFVSAVAAKWNGIDILINNAGITRDGLLMRMSEEQWDEVIRVNLKSIFNLTKEYF